MKYAIYDKVSDAYLTKMVFEVGYSEHTQFECGLNEYITKAELLDTKKAADDAVARIEDTKFMAKGRFVVHSFDETLADQYIISEAGNPTKVVDNITVDLDGNINVKYGTMACHWSTKFLIRAITRLDALQKAVNAAYTPWYETFDVYKVITVIDEREHTHYQFIKVTEKGLASAKEEDNLVVGKDITDITDPLNKRIEELEKANDMLTDSVNYHNECRLVLAEIIRAIKYAICSKDSDKRTNYISYMTDKIKNDETFNRTELKTTKNDIPKICKHLTALDSGFINKRIEELENANYDLGEQVAARGAVANRLQEENDNLKNKVESIKKEARHWKTMYESALTDNNFPCISAAACEILKDITDITRAKKLANDIIDICEANDKFEITLKKFSQLYEAVNNPSDNDDTIMYAFKGVLEIFSSLENHVRNIIDESVVWKNKAIKAEKALNDQKALNKANTDVIEHMRTSGADWKRRAEEAIRAYTKCNDALGEWKRKCKAKDADYEMLKNKLKACEIILESTQSSLTETIKERDEALELKELYKRQANSVYGMTTCRCNGKQMFYDITTGKKILVDKEKYDDLVKYVANINLTYDNMFCMMDKPIYLSVITESLNDLTK